MSLVNYRGNLVHKDCISILEKVDKQGKELGLKPITFKGAPLDYKFSPYSALHTGREISIYSDNNIADIWSLVIPLGLIPWNRYPVNDSNTHKFHYYGKWTSVINTLHEEGLGEYAWSSFCCVSLIEIGKWEGDNTLIRTVQTHLHRLGVHCGPVDGVLNERTVLGLKSLGLLNKQLPETIEALSNLTYIQDNKPKETSTGLLFINNECEVITTGQVQAVKTNQGYRFHIGGQGKIIAHIN